MPKGIGYGNAAKMSAKNKKRKSTDEYMDEMLKKKKAEKSKKKTQRTSDVEKKLRAAGLTEDEIKRLRGK